MSPAGTADPPDAARTGDPAAPAAWLAAQRQIVEAATHAPSVHNSQPWRFSCDDDGLHLYADEGRRLTVLDPYGRQLHLSCGAALLHAQVAARALGLDAATELLPDADDPSRLATLRLTTGSEPSSHEQALADAIPLRHTYRDAFDEQPLPEELLTRLRLAAEAQGARLRALTDPDDVVELSVLLSWADGIEEADPAYRQELASWVHTEPGQDGIPVTALPDDPERGSSLRLRDFGLSGPRPGGGEPPVAERPDVVVIVSDDDSPRSWLQAGQALGAVLLEAAHDGVMAQPLAQVTDFAAVRLRLRNALSLAGTPQLALRIGYATGVDSTPRRSVDDVLGGPGPRD
ncbi:MAG: Acg family FMN-binding oxidoreductase [Mycobacteriales bacterium]